MRKKLQRLAPFAPVVGFCRSWVLSHESFFVGFCRSGVLFCLDPSDICMLTAQGRDQLQNPYAPIEYRTTFAFFYLPIDSGLFVGLFGDNMNTATHFKRGRQQHR